MKISGRNEDLAPRRTERLLLRPFTPDDAPEVQRLAGAREVALNTLHIPHPYPDGAAEAWIAKQGIGPEVVFAIDADGQLAGAIGLVIDRSNDRAELGYWIGVPFWSRGYATEAGRAIVRFGFDELELHRVFAQVFTRNPASARVLQKIGMRREGVLRHHFKKWDAYVDVECYGLLRDDFDSPA
ncbi:MAG TPA: GNAT family N-acetyltransferase [Thermoanaerobaculia bacterium]|nr:GNAT family N-acetyltransferase [Thermoanaerobaculia bacterium]